MSAGSVAEQVSAGTLLGGMLGSLPLSPRGVALLSTACLAQRSRTVSGNGNGNATQRATSLTALLMHVARGVLSRAWARLFSVASVAPEELLQDHLVVETFLFRC